MYDYSLPEAKTALVETILQVVRDSYKPPKERDVPALQLLYLVAVVGLAGVAVWQFSHNRLTYAYIMAASSVLAAVLYLTSLASFYRWRLRAKVKTGVHACEAALSKNQQFTGVDTSQVTALFKECAQFETSWSCCLSILNKIGPQIAEKAGRQLGATPLFDAPPDESLTFAKRAPLFSLWDTGGSTFYQSFLLADDGESKRIRWKALDLSIAAQKGHQSAQGILKVCNTIEL